MLWSLLLAAALAPSAQEALSHAYPRAKVVSSTSCAMGPQHTEAFGAVVVLPSKDGPDLAHLRAVIGVKTRDGWKIHPLDRKVDVEDVGSAADFLDELVSDGRVEPISLECTVPSAKGRISTDLGKFTVQDAKLRRSPQLCFAASTVYNSWVCFTLERGAPRQSFVQLVAD